MEVTQLIKTLKTNYPIFPPKKHILTKIFFGPLSYKFHIQIPPTRSSLS